MQAAHGPICPYRWSCGKCPLSCGFPAIGERVSPGDFTEYLTGLTPATTAPSGRPPVYLSQITRDEVLFDTSGVAGGVVEVPERPSVAVERVVAPNEHRPPAAHHGRLVVSFKSNVDLGHGLQCSPPGTA
jgi:hypothetical protein